MANKPAADWEFRGANTKGLTHCFHAYPAMMIPQIAGRLIDAYGAGAKVVFDPYCGTGTSLVEATLRGAAAKGTDLNPLARLIARAKTAPLSPQTLRLYLRDLNEKLFENRFGGGGENGDDGGGLDAPPMLKNPDFWFAKPVRRKLAAIKFHLDQIDDDAVRRFFLVCLSETVRESSYTRNGEFKLYRMAARQMANFDPDVFGMFVAKAARNLRGLQDYLRAPGKRGRAEIFGFNSAAAIPPDCVAPDSVDLIVTSPPYGDSRTTVAYGQFSRLAAEWLGYPDAAALDRRLMGGDKTADWEAAAAGGLASALDLIKSRDLRRAQEVGAFYRDYRRSVANAAATVKPGGFACYVVGNRKVKGVTLATDAATRLFFAENGFRHAATFTRAIPNKRMPSKNSPSNIPGATDTTMKDEYIVVMQKPR